MSESYLKQRLQALEITPELNKIRVERKEELGAVEMDFFSEDNHGNIRFLYLMPDGSPVEYLHDNKTERQFYRTRLKQPVNDQKYSQPPKTEVYPFITPIIIEAFTQVKDFDTLYIVEGEFKAFAGYLAGLHTIGIGGIHSYKDKKQNDIDPIIKQLIERCKVNNIVLLFDADCLTVKYEAGKDLFTRPNLFYSAVKTFKELTTPLNVSVYFSHIKSEFQNYAKGLDDLLYHKDTDKELVLKELKSFTAGKDRKYIECLSISDNSINKLFKYFAIESPSVFYDRYASILQEKEFIFNGNRYRHDGEKLKVSWYGKANQYLRVATNFYKKVYQRNVHGDFEEVLEDWAVSEINRDFNNNKDFINQIMKFDRFVNYPDNTKSYKRIVAVEFESYTSILYNRYHALNHELLPGDYPQIEKFLKHIFNTHNLKGDNLYEFGLDYIQLLFFEPRQRLPVLCFVSRERNTGKSTFLEFLRLIFKENMTILDNERFTGKFTSHFIDKLVIAVDESFIPVEQKLMKERIKNFATGKKQWLEAKGKAAQELDYFGKLILCSNDETNFMQIDEGENRFAVIKVQPLKGDDPRLIEKMKPEIPYFLYFLSNRKLKYETNKSRFSFDTSVYMTELMRDVIEATRPRIETEIKELLRQEFIKLKFQYLEFCPEDIVLLVNESNQRFKIDKNQVRNYLKFTLKMQPQKLKKYTLYTVVYNDYDKEFIVERSQYKSGTPFVFYYKDWLTDEDIKDYESLLQSNEM
jgi:hypothetical protein